VLIMCFVLSAAPAYAQTDAAPSDRPSGQHSIDLINAGDMEAALQEAEAAIASNRVPAKALVARAYIRAIHLNDDRGALSDLRRLLAFGPQGADAFEGAGYSRLTLEEIDRAIEFYALEYGISHPSPAPIQ